MGRGVAVCWRNSVFVVPVDKTLTLMVFLLSNKRGDGVMSHTKQEEQEAWCDEAELWMLRTPVSYPISLSMASSIV